jgi:signal transduction histidine kinase
MNERLPLSSFPTDLLVAAFSPEANCIHTNTAWDRVMGEHDSPWHRLNDDDQDFAQEYLDQALGGSLVTNQVFLLNVPGHEEPVPVLLNFIPAYFKAEDQETSIHGANISGEVLTEPSSWMPGQTQQRRLEMLGRMAMGVTHDFNNLLSSILGYTELLQSALRTGNTDSANEMYDYLATIEQAATDGAALIDKIQQYIRREKEVHFEPVDIPELIDDCIALTRPYWYNEPRRQSLSITMNRQLTEVPPVLGSDAALREIFVNLILNAVQAMPDGGEITIATDYDPEQGIIVTVGDTGIGMTDHVQSKIFEPMFTTRGKEGTGMGLAVSYGIIQEHDGSIDVESSPGEGTQFYLTFPPASSGKDTDSTEKPDTLETTVSVLVVDDQKMICDVVDRLLTLKGHEVTQANTGEEALEIADHRSFDIAFTDLGLPDISGYEVAEGLRSRYAEMPIVLMTGHTEREIDGETIDMVIDKPFKIEKIEDAIHKLVPPQSLLRPGT